MFGIRPQLGSQSRLIKGATTEPRAAARKVTPAVIMSRIVSVIEEMILRQWLIEAR